MVHLVCPTIWDSHVNKHALYSILNNQTVSECLGPQRKAEGNGKKMRQESLAERNTFQCHDKKESNNQVEYSKV